MVLCPQRSSCVLFGTTVGARTVDVLCMCVCKSMSMQSQSTKLRNACCRLHARRVDVGLARKTAAFEPCSDEPSRLVHGSCCAAAAHSMLSVRGTCDTGCDEFKALPRQTSSPEIPDCALLAQCMHADPRRLNPLCACRGRNPQRCHSGSSGGGEGSSAEAASQLEAFLDLSSHLDAPSQATTSSWLHLLQGAQEFLQGDMGLTALPQMSTGTTPMT
eukprot:1160985-Pelagomonas_calceolata.AAC.6